MNLPVFFFGSYQPKGIPSRCRPLRLVIGFEVPLSHPLRGRHVAFHPFKKVKRLGSLKVIFVFWGEETPAPPPKNSLVGS